MIKSSQFQIQEKSHQRLSGVGKFPLLQEKEKKMFILQIAKLLPSFFSYKKSNYPVQKLLNMLPNANLSPAKCTKCRDKYRSRIRPYTEGNPKLEVRALIVVFINISNDFFLYLPRKKKSQSGLRELTTWPLKIQIHLQLKSESVRTKLCRLQTADWA